MKRQVEGENHRLNEAITQRDGQITQLSALVRERDEHLQRVDADLQRLNELSRTELARSDTALAAAKVQIAALSDQAQDAEKRLADCDRQLTELNFLIRERDEQLLKLDAELQQLNAVSRAELERSLTALQKATQDTAVLSQQVQNGEKRLAELDRQLGALNLSARAEIEQLTQRVHLGEEQLREQNGIYTNTLAAKEKLREETIQELEKLRQLVAEKKVAYPSRDVEATLRRAQMEASAASKLLGISHGMMGERAQWFFAPAARFSSASGAVVCNFELIELNPNLGRISGWAFTEDPNAIPLQAPLLVSADARGAWMFRGVTVARPDVAEAYPTTSMPNSSRIDSGFIFEFLRQDLPPEVGQVLRVAFAQTDGGLLFTPEFALR
jgi:predicted DNA-binding transcriptional regulator